MRRTVWQRVHDPPVPLDDDDASEPAATPTGYAELPIPFQVCLWQARLRIMAASVGVAVLMPVIHLTQSELETFFLGIVIGIGIGLAIDTFVLRPIAHFMARRASASPRR